MERLVRLDCSLLAVVTDTVKYVDALKQAEAFAEKYEHQVADMPMVVHALANYPWVREAIRPERINTLTGEYHGLKGGARSYRVLHSFGPLKTADALENALPNAGDYALMPVPDNDWAAIGGGNYNGQQVGIVDLHGLRNGDVPTPGTPYVVDLAIPDDYQLIPLVTDIKDVLEMHKSGRLTIFERGQLSADQFRLDDRVASVAGSPENVERLVKMLFSKKEERGEGWSSVGSYHRIEEVGFNPETKTRLVFLSYNDGGFGGSSCDGYWGRFVTLAGSAMGANPQSLAQQR